MSPGRASLKPDPGGPAATAAPENRAKDILNIKSLHAEFRFPKATVPVLVGIDLAVGENEILGLVGESGSGKSVTALAIMGLLRPPGFVTGGEIRFQKQDLVGLDAERLRAVRGRQISMIFQNPGASLNPVLPVGRTLMEVFRVHAGLRSSEAAEQAEALLLDVGLPNPASVLRRYPHQLSGGMAQRVMIALALASSPRLLLADEPTTALDVTIQYQIIRLLSRLRRHRGLSQIVITHNLGVIAELCDRVAVMYAGMIFEEAPVELIFDEPRHPYTQGLLAARARTEGAGTLANIPGQVPDLRDRPGGCPFHPRCSHARAICSSELPARESCGDRHRVACHRWKEIA